MKAVKLIPLLLLSLLSCRQTGNDALQTPAATLIEQAAKDVASQKFEQAMQKSLKALELSEDDPLMQIKALSSIVGVDIITSRDADAWEKALEAEELARKHGHNKELAGILISKAKLCSYAEISPETARNDEGLEYAKEAIGIASKEGYSEEEAEANLVAGSLYINKNRWSNPIDREIYRTAGEYLDRGQAIADSCGIERLRRNGFLFRSRWFQQGDRNDEALEYFASAREALPEGEHLMASALDDRLVRLYTRTGDAQKALDTHDDYVREITRYMNQKSDEVLQEMETRFEVQEKERAIESRNYQITILLMIILLAVAIIMIVTNYLRSARRRNAELLQINDTKEQLITLLSKNLQKPTNAYKSEIEQLAIDAATLSPEDIRERCRLIAASAETINEDVAAYVGDILIERGRKIADIGLSKREIEIIRLSAEGLSASEIAERLFLSVHTVNTHRQRIYAKMDVKNVSDMLRKASDLGLV